MSGEHAALSSPQTVAVIGMGYVGLTTAVGLARLGHRVHGVEIDEARVRSLQAGRVPIHEPGLEAALAELSGTIQFTTEIAEALRHDPDVVMLAVQTPAKDGEPSDTSFLESAARDVGRHLKQPATIVVRSTAPVGTTARVRDLVSAELRQPVRAVANPEFLAEGKALESFLRPDRIVVGVDDAASADLMRKLYEPLDAPVVVTDFQTAEVTKYIANAFLATEISFINEMADLAEALGADIRVISQALRLDERIGPGAYLDAGLGFGGSCLPKDLRTIIHTGASWGVTLQLARAVYAVNEERVARLEGKLRKAIGDLAGARVAVWGLAFKGGTDDVRDSPATRFVQRLARLGAAVRAYDPLANARAEGLVGPDVLCDDMYAAVADADALVIVTDCPEFAAFDFAAVHTAMRRPLIIDGRNALAASAARAHGFEYLGVGTPERESEPAVIPQEHAAT